MARLLSFYDKTHPLSAAYNEYWEKLVPASGPCETLEGELLRAASRIMHDYYNNGFGNNWSGAFNFLDHNLGLIVRWRDTLKPYKCGRVAKNPMFDASDPIAVALEEIMENVVEYVTTANGDYNKNPCDMFDWQERDDYGDEDDYDDEENEELEM